MQTKGVAVAAAILVCCNALPTGVQSSVTTSLDSSLNVTKPFYEVEAAVEDWYTKKNISGKVAEYFKDWNKRDVNGETTVGVDASVNLTKLFYEAEAAAEDWYTKKNISGKVAEYFKDWNKRDVNNIENIDGDFPKAINRKNRTERHDQSTFNHTSPFCLKWGTDLSACHTKHIATPEGFKLKDKYQVDNVNSDPKDKEVEGGSHDTEGEETSNGHGTQKRYWPWTADTSDPDEGVRAYGPAICEDENGNDIPCADKFIRPHNVGGSGIKSEAPQGWKDPGPSRGYPGMGRNFYRRDEDIHSEDEIHKRQYGRYPEGALPGAGRLQGAPGVHPGFLDQQGAQRGSPYRAAQGSLDDMSDDMGPPALPYHVIDHGDHFHRIFPRAVSDVHTTDAEVAANKWYPPKIDIDRANAEADEGLPLPHWMHEFVADLPGADPDLQKFYKTGPYRNVEGDRQELRNVAFGKSKRLSIPVETGNDVLEKRFWPFSNGDSTSASSTSAPARAGAGVTTGASGSASDHSSGATRPSRGAAGGNPSPMGPGFGDFSLDDDLEVDSMEMMTIGYPGDDMEDNGFFKN